MPYADPEKNRQAIAKYHKDNPEEIKENRRRSRNKLKRETMDAYGEVCACCGESHIVFLTLDHVDGDGADKRREEGHRGGTQQYRRLRKLGFPPGFQVLCWNCNAAVHILGDCPHRSTL